VISNAEVVKDSVFSSKNILRIVIVKQIMFANSNAKELSNVLKVNICALNYMVIKVSTDVDVEKINANKDVKYLSVINNVRETAIMILLYLTIAASGILAVKNVKIPNV
jgi:hypothetical protein